MSLGAPPAPRFRLLQFIRHPVPELAPAATAPAEGRALANLRAGVRLWAACLAAALLTAPVALIGAEVSGAGNRVEDVPLGTLAVLAILVAPLVEETGFRLPLARFRPGWLVIAGLALAFLAAPWGTPFVLLLVALSFVPALRAGLARLWAQRFPLVFWSSAVLFGLLHTLNWELDGLGWRAVLLVPLLVLPQTGLGLVLGAARVRLGLGGAIVVHAAYNASILSLTLL